MEARRLAALRAATLATSLIVSFAIVEVGLRATEAQRGQPMVVRPTGSQYAFYRYDPVLGWANAAGMHGIYEREEFRFPIRINAHGMRDAPVARARGDRLRLAVLGDSFTWGVGVADEDRFSERLEADHGVEVLNFGVSGYAPIQYLLMLDDVLSFEPDIVLLAFCLGNDLKDNVVSQRYGYYGPWADLGADGELVLRGEPIPDVKDFGSREPVRGSRVVARVREWFERSFLLPEREGILDFRVGRIEPLETLAPDMRTRIERVIRINELLLGRIRDRVRESGSELVVVAVSTKCEYWQRCGHGAPGRRDTVHSILERTLARLDVLFVPTLDVLGPSDFWIQDAHWRASGHRRVAERIGEVLVREGLLPAADPSGSLATTPPG